MFEQVNLITIHGKRVIRILLQILTKFTTTESIGNWELFKIKMSCYKKYTKVFMGKLIRKYMKTMISTLKSLILINSVKKIAQRRAPYRGSPQAVGSLRRPAARGLKCGKNSNFFENTLPILTYNTYDTILTKKMYTVKKQMYTVTKFHVHGHLGELHP